MARPQKTGIDYFPLDVNMDDKVRLVDAKFGVAGFGILVKVWQIIYDNGYFIKWTEKELLLYKSRINADINLINDVINECLKWGIFNLELYETYSILTSSGIQKRYFEATKRRTEIVIVKEFVLVLLPDNYKPAIKTISAEVIVSKNSKNADSNSRKADSSTQSKVKYSKVKNIFVDDSIEYQLSLKLKSLILRNNPNARTPKNLQRWSKEFDLMMRIDKRTPEQIREVIEFSQNDSFWKSNILSAKKVRAKFDTLWLQKDRAKGKPSPGANFEQRAYDKEHYENLYEDV